MKIPRDHPRYFSLMTREKIVEGYKKGATVLEGLIAHGRGEAFNYLLGEVTVPEALDAIKASAAALLLAENPVISVNGNTAALCPGEMVQLAKSCNGKVEVNLFYRSGERAKIIEKILLENGAGKVYGAVPESEIPGLSSERRKVSSEGIYKSDVVLVAIEDGDRTEALVKAGKKVIALDLNPLSRTAIKADITVVDDVIRAVPLIIEAINDMKGNSRDENEKLADFDNKKNLKGVMKRIKVVLENFEP